MAGTRRLLARFQPGVARLVVIDGAGHHNLAQRAEYAALLSGPR